MKWAALALVGLLVILGVFGVVFYVTYSNSEIRLRNQLVAQQKANEAVFDNTWKIIQQQAGVADQYKNAFKEIYPQLMEGRYGNERGGALLSFIQESNPTFDVSLYKILSASIEAQRMTFTNEQKKLIDLKREHDNLLDTFPGSLILGARGKFEIKVITSAKTEQTFASGQENDVNLFNTEKK